MRGKKRTFQSRNPLSSIPNLMSPPEGVFDSLEHYRTVAQRVTLALAGRSSKANSSKTTGSSLYDGIRIDFSPKYKKEEIFLDNYESKIVLLAPQSKDEPEASLRARTMYYYQMLLPAVEAMKSSGISYIYLSLKSEGRKAISKPSTGKRRPE